jgi:hypothetical protein
MLSLSSIATAMHLLDICSRPCPFEEMPGFGNSDSPLIVFHG